MAFNVINIIDGNTIEVSPNWQWGDYKGNFVKILGYQINDPQLGPFAKGKLNTLLLNKMVELKNPTTVNDYDSNNKIIYCYVFLNEIEISQYFPELKRV